VQQKSVECCTFLFPIFLSLSPSFSPQEKANNRRLKKGRQKDRQENDDDEGDEGQMKVQLQKLGLELKEISGDG
jgi:hypothetical protein